MWDKKIIAISDRKCVEIDFLTQVEKLAKSGIDAFVLREKDLSEFEYYDLAKEVLAICAKHKTTCFLHFFDRECLKLGHRYFHMPLGKTCSFYISEVFSLQMICICSQIPYTCCMT